MSDGYQDDPDVILMLQLSRGDRAAFEQLVTKHQKRVLNAIYRYTGNPSVSEELAQDVFVRVYHAAPQYKASERFSTWLFTIVRNVCVNHNTRQGKHDRQTDSIEFDSFVVAENPEKSLIRLSEVEPVQYCQWCGTPHHEECFKLNGRCTVFGCERPVPQQELVSPQSTQNTQR